MTKKIIAAMLAVMLLTASFGAVYARDWDSDYSVIAKPAPELVPFPVEDTEEPIVAIIRDADGEVVKYVPEGELLITAYSEKDAAEIADITNTLNAAYEQLSTALITELNPGVEGYVQGIDPEIKADELVVRDLFDARLTEEYAEYLEPEGNTIEINFNANVEEGTFLMVMANSDIYNQPVWDIIPAAKTVGVVARSFNYLCPIIFVAQGAQPQPPTPPGTGTISFVIIGAALIIAGAGIVLLKKKASRA